MIHRLMSFHEAGSDVSKLNREACKRGVAVSSQTVEVLLAAQELSSDPTTSSSKAHRRNYLRELRRPPMPRASRSPRRSATDHSKTFRRLFPQTTAASTDFAWLPGSPAHSLVCFHKFQIPSEQCPRPDGTPGSAPEEWAGRPCKTSVGLWAQPLAVKSLGTRKEWRSRAALWGKSSLLDWSSANAAPVVSGDA